MDIIAGIVTITAAFVLGVALLFVVGARRPDSARAPHAGQGLSLAGVAGAQVVVYFVATTHLLLIAEQPGLAAGNAVVGLVFYFLQFAEPALRGGRGRGEGADEGGDWRR